MDEIKIKTNKWSPILARIIMHFLKKKLGLSSMIKINSFGLFEIDGKLHLHVDFDGEIDEDSVISKILTKLV